LAVLGITVNGFAAWKISKGKIHNKRILIWLLMEDVLGRVSVLIVSILLLFLTGRYLFQYCSWFSPVGIRWWKICTNRTSRNWSYDFCRKPTVN